MNDCLQPFILVVDDDPAIRRLLNKRLGTWDYRVTTAEGGCRAVELIQQECPEVVITDLFMPDGDGFELLLHIRKTVPDLPVIVMSGQGDLKDAVQALRLGAWDYLVKPFKEKSFLQRTIDQVLEKARLIRENRNYRDHLEMLVARKNTDLIRKQQALVEKTISQEKANEALKALLRQREIEQKAIEQTMVSNLKRYVFPYLDELERRPAGHSTATLTNIIRTNIDQLVAPVYTKLSGAYILLTPMEVRVADLIRQGASSKGIADFLNMSVSTVEKHRNKIRKKLCLLKKKVNLQTFLNSLT